MITFKIDIFNLYKEFQKLKRTVPGFIEQDKHYEISFFHREDEIPVNMMSEKGILIISSSSLIKNWILELPADYKNIHVSQPDNVKPFSAWMITATENAFLVRNGAEGAELPN